MIEAHNITSLEGNSLERAIQDDFGFEITNTKKIIKGFSNQVYEGNMEDKTVFIRTNKDKNVFEVEQVGYNIFEEQGIPVPKIIAYQENPKTIGFPTMIMSSAEGKILSESNVSLEQRDIVYENLGKLLNKIHETKIKDFGPMKVSNQELIGKFSTWKERCLSAEKKNKIVVDFSINNEYINNEEARKIQEIYKEISELDFGEASLLHSDLHHGHFFIKGTEITGIIDLGALEAGDPRYDIAMSMIFQNSREQEHFKKGYGELADDPMVNKYIAKIAIGKIYGRSQRDIKGNVESLIPILKDALHKIS
jgi:aminoglycoside phosphotransferase (APT) family kinase protein